MADDMPDKAEQLACRRHADKFGVLAGVDQLPVAGAQAPLRFPGDGRRRRC